MPQNTLFAGTRGYGHNISEDRLPKIVSAEGLMLEPNIAKIVTILAGLGLADENAGSLSSKPWERQEYRFTEYEYPPLWLTLANVGTIPASGGGSTSFQLSAGQGKLVAPNMQFVIPNGVASATPPEVIRCTAIDRGTDIMTVVRGVNGTTPAIVPIGAGILRIGSTWGDATGPADSLGSMPVEVTCHFQTFKKAWTMGTQAAVIRPVGIPMGMSEKDWHHTNMMKDAKRELAMAIYWGKGGLDTSNPSQPAGQIEGLINRCTANNFDAGGTITFNSFLLWAETAFRYGSDSKFLFGPHIFARAFNTWNLNKQLTARTDNVFGANVTRLELMGKELVFVHDPALDDAVAGQNSFKSKAFLVDVNPEDVFLWHLAGHDFQLREDVIQNGVQATTDEFYGTCGLVVKHPKKHGMIYNVTAYA